MAKLLSLSGIETGNLVEAQHVSQSILAFRGLEAYDITVSGSVAINGITYPYKDADSGSVLMTDGAGNATFQPVFTSASYISSSNVDGPYGMDSVQSASWSQYAVNAGFATNANAAVFAISAQTATTATTASFALSASFVQQKGSEKFCFVNQTIVPVVHGLESESVVVQSYEENPTTTKLELIIPDNVVIDSKSQVTVKFAVPTTGCITISGGGFLRSGSVEVAQTASRVQNSLINGTGIDALEFDGSSVQTVSINQTYIHPSSSYALTASYVSSSNIDGPFGMDSILSASYVLSSSYAVTSSHSLEAISASYVLSSSYAVTSSHSLEAISASYVLSSSYAVTSSHALETVSASYVETASYAVTSSHALEAISASYVLSSSYAVTSSHALETVSASYALTASYAISSSHTEFADSSSYALTSSYAVTSSHTEFADSSSYALTSSYAVTSSHTEFADSSSYALTASYAISSSVEITKEVSSSYAETASYAISSSHTEFADSSSYSVTSSYAVTASHTEFADSSSYALTASYAITASLALTASFLNNASYDQSVSSATPATFNIVHNLKSTFPIVASYNNINQQVIPETVEIINVNQVDVTFAGAFTGNIVVKK